MTDKELRKLKRTELLEILFYLRKENDRLEQEILSLRQQLENGGALPDNFMQQIERTVRETVEDCLSRKSVLSDNGPDAKTGQTGDEK